MLLCEVLQSPACVFVLCDLLHSPNSSDTVTYTSIVQMVEGTVVCFAAVPRIWCY